MTQKHAIAYGHPAYGGVVLGGSNVGIYTLGDDWTDFQDEESVAVSGSLWIHGTEAEIDTRFNALLSAWKKEQGNLGITFGSRVSGSINLTISSREIILTATAGTPFSSTDLGLPVVVGTLGSFQISTVTSTTVVRCRVAEPSAMPIAANGLAFSIGRAYRRCIETSKEQGFNAVADLRQAISPENEPGRRLYSFRIAYATPAREARPESGGNPVDRRRAEIRMNTPLGGARTVQFSGSFAAGGGDLALANYQSQIAAWVNDRMALFLGAAPGFEVIGDDVVTLDDRENTLTFQITRREVVVDLQSLNDPAIKNADITFVRRDLNAHGLSGDSPPAIIQAFYSAIVPRLTYTESTLERLWTEVAYPFVVAKIEAIYRGPVIVMETSGPTWNPVSGRIQANLVAIMPSTGSKIINYSRTLSLVFDERKNYRDVWDAEDYSSVRNSPGPAAGAVVTVRYTELNSIGRGSRAAARGGVFGVGPLNVDFGGAGLGIFGPSGQLQIVFNEPGDQANEASGGRQEFNAMGAPSALDEILNAPPFNLSIAAAEWDHERTEVSISSQEIGDVKNGVGLSAVQVSTTIRREWRWVNLKGVSDRSGVATGGVQGDGRITSAERAFAGEGSSSPVIVQPDTGRAGANQ